MKQPLYKVLNEQRTQGVLIAGKNGHLDIKPKTDSHDYLVGTNTFGTVNSISLKDEEVSASTQYTALAVNNLHHLAEALEGMLDEIRKQGYSEYMPTQFDKAKEALSLIS